MLEVLLVVLGVVVLVAVAAAAWLAIDRARILARSGEELRRVEEVADERLAGVEAVHAERLAAAKRVSMELEQRLHEFDEKMRTTFAAMSSAALKQTSEHLVTIAEQKLDGKRAAVDQLIKPIAETLRRLEERNTALSEQVRAGQDSQQQLRGETARLVQALRVPQVRGRYGEMQLKRVAELAGMIEHCDYAEQDQTVDAEGRALRPDMLVRMPSGRELAIDAKTNIRAYLEALEAGTPEEQERCLERFARHVSTQAASLGKKGYWSRYEGSPEFVVMFIPGEQFIEVAMRRLPELLEEAAARRVIVVGPGSLIGLLRAVAVGWREKGLEDQAKELFELGRQLHERAAVVSEHVGKMGGALEQAVRRFNDLVGSYQSRLEPTLRKFEEVGAKSARELTDVAEVSVSPRLFAPRADGMEPVRPG